MTDLPRTDEVTVPCMEDPEKWFDKDHQAEAKRICRTQCPQRIQVVCLQLALAAEGRKVSTYRFGVFGGMSPRDRWRITAGKPRKAAGRPPAQQPSDAA